MENFEKKWFAADGVVLRQMGYDLRQMGTFFGLKKLDGYLYCGRWVHENFQKIFPQLW